jgi:uncharacterized protein
MSGKMLTRRFGRTGLQLPVFSCGGMRYQYQWQDRPLSEIPAENQANVEATIGRAIDLGINHIETAHGYGSSERQLGKVLEQLDREKLVIQTKVSPQADPGRFEAQFEESLERLRLDHVDLFSLHGINNEEILSWSLRPGGCFDVAQKLRERGRCRFVGFSTHGSTDLILKAIRHGEARVGAGFDYVNLHWYFIFQRNWEAILEAGLRDMGVFIISPSDKGGRLYQPPPTLTQLCAPLSPMVFNDLFCLSHPGVHTLSLGAARPSDFEEHLKVLPMLDSPQQYLRPVIARLRAQMLEKTGFPDPEAILPGLPRWEDTPRHYNLPIMLWLRNLARGWDMMDYARMRYNMLKNAGHWFPGNKPTSPDEVDETELLAVLGEHPQRALIPELVRDCARLLHGEEQKRLSQGD